MTIKTKRMKKLKEQSLAMMYKISHKKYKPGKSEVIIIYPNEVVDLNGVKGKITWREID